MVNSLPDVEVRSVEICTVLVPGVDVAPFVAVCVVDICVVVNVGAVGDEVIVVVRESFSTVAVKVELALLSLPEVTSFEEIPARPSNTEPA